MRVLMVNHFPLEGSGSGTYTKNLAMELTRLGHEVCVICPEVYEDRPTYDGVRVHPVYFLDKDGHKQADGALSFRFPCFTSHPYSDYTFGDMSDFEWGSYLGAFSAAIDEELRNFKPDVIHAQHLWVLSSLACNLGVPVVATCHGTDLMGCDRWPDMRRFAEDVLNYASAVICISEDNENLLRSMFPSLCGNVIMMRNGYNSEIFHVRGCDKADVLSEYSIYADDADVVLFAGKLTRFKGVDVLLDAVNIYNDALDDVVTIIAGDGDEAEVLFDKAWDMDLDNVFFIGNVGQEELARLYDVASVSVVPSRREPFGLVALEALGCGTPVVATNQGGLPDFVDSSVGCLVEPEYAVCLAQGICMVLDRVHTGVLCSDAISDYARKSFSQAVVVGKVLDVYDSAVACSG